MNGNNLLLDTNIVLYLLEGDNTLAELLDGKEIFISFISEIELLSYKKMTRAEEEKIKKLLSDVFIIDMNTSIKQKTIELRKEYNLKLPDSIIAATSEHLNIPLLSADTSFKKVDAITHLFYQH